MSSFLNYTIEIINNSFLVIKFVGATTAHALLENIIVSKIIVNQVAKTDNFLLRDGIGLEVELNFTKCNNISASDLDEFFDKLNRIISEKRARTKNFLTSIDEKLISGRKIYNIFGENPDMDATVVEDIWSEGGLYVPPTTARLHDISSSDVADDGTSVTTGTATGGTIRTITDSGATFVTNSVAAGDLIINETQVTHAYVVSVDSETSLTITKLKSGNTIIEEQDALVFTSGDTYEIVTPGSTGAAVVKLDFTLDSDFALVGGEYIIMNGTTIVTTSSTYTRINRMKVVLCGTGACSAGKIVADAQTDATITNVIQIGETFSQLAFFTIPKDKIGKLNDFQLTTSRPISNSVVSVSLYTREDVNISNTPEQRLNTINIVGTGGSVYKQTLEGGLDLPEKTDIWFRTKFANTNNNRITASMIIITTDVVKAS